MTRIETAAVAAFVVSLIATPLAIIVARRFGVVDHPGQLKPQQKGVPYLGGVGVFCGLGAGVAIVRPELLIPLALALALGTADDVVDIPPRLRLLGELIIGISSGLIVATRIEHGLSVVLVAGVTILLVNGVNLIDGLDGLAGGVSAVAAGVFVLLLRGDSRGVACALGLALIGFLIYNCPPARVYLGDGGSYLIGTCLALLVATAWQTGVPSERGLASLLVVALPAAEIVLAITRRARRRTSLTEGDRDHPYDRMVRRGWPRVAATATYVVVELLLGVVAILVARTKTLVGPLSADIAVAVVVLALIGTTIVMFPPDGTRNT